MTCRALAVSGLVNALFLPVIVISAEPTAVTVGDGRVDGKQIQPYEFTWLQCSRRDDTWVDGGTLTERARIVEREKAHFIEIQQETIRPGGASSRSSTYLDRETLAPRRIELHVYNAAHHVVATVSYEFGADGYTGTKTQGDDRQLLSGPLSDHFYHGMNLGLPLATLDLPGDLPLELPVSMISYDATYRVIATYAGSETMQFGDASVEAHMIDVEWHHLDQEDVYPPGPDASGGRFWIIPDPPEDVPYVMRYKTDSYAIEFVADTCAEAMAPIQPH